MLKINPKICARRWKPDNTHDLVIDTSLLTFKPLTPLEIAYTEEDRRYKSNKAINARRITHVMVQRKNQADRQAKALERAMLNRAKQEELKIWEVKRKSELMAFYGGLAREMFRQKQAEDSARRLHLDLDEQLNIFDNFLGADRIL